MCIHILPGRRRPGETGGKEPDPHDLKELAEGDLVLAERALDPYCPRVGVASNLFTLPGLAHAGEVGLAAAENVLEAVQRTDQPLTALELLFAGKLRLDHDPPSGRNRASRPGARIAHEAGSGEKGLPRGGLIVALQSTRGSVDGHQGIPEYPDGISKDDLP